MAEEVFMWSYFSCLVTAGALMTIPDAPSLSIWKVMCSNLLFFFFLSLVPIFQRMLCSLWCNVHISSKYQNKVKLLLFPGGWRVRSSSCAAGVLNEAKRGGKASRKWWWDGNVRNTFRGAESFPSRLSSSSSSAKKDLCATDAALFPRQTTQIIK